MRALLRFIRFQEEQGGILTIDDAAEFANVNRSLVHAWAVKRRVAFIERHGRRYFGLASLRDWVAFTRSAATYESPFPR